MAQHRSWLLSPVPLVFVAIVALAAGGAAGLWIGLSRTPANIAAPQPAHSIPIVTAPFDDARQVQLKMTAQAGLALTAHATGVVTSTTCERGVQIESGTTPWRINGAPVLALAGEIPYYRDFAIGDVGPDVMSLQRELARIGQDVRVSGTYDAQTSFAVGVLLAAAGPDIHGLPLATLTWLPHASIRIESCSTVLGGPVTDGAPLAIAAGAVTDLRIAPMPPAMVPGEREFAVGDVAVPIAGDGRMPDGADVDRILATDAGAVAVLTAASSDPVPLKGTLALVEPIDAATVPATAILSSADAMCVFDDSGTAYDVNVVDSALGRSVVQFQSAVPKQVLVAPVGEATCSS